MDRIFVMDQAMLAHQGAMRKAIAQRDSPIQNFYEGSVVFVTGGTGFLGKLLIEKLLRTCAPSKIYVLVRHKKDKTPKERLNEILKDPLYDLLRKERADFAEKLSIIQGDVSELRLGLSDDDWKTLSEQVHVIFHMAANVRFDVELKAALLSNSRGTREALCLAADCKQLRAFVHVSTAYTHATRDRVGQVVPEKFYESPAPPEAMIQLAETLSNDKLNAMTPAFISNWPNTYSFSKAVSEDIVRRMGANLPVCIVRPAIVTCTYRDPIPGWLDMSCAYGPSGLILGVGVGIMHVNYINEDLRIDMVPADIVNNATIVAAWETARRQSTWPEVPKIYTVSSSRKPITYGELYKNCDAEKKNIPTAKAVWYCFTNNTKYKFLYILLSWFLHYIPGYIVDGVCFVIGKPQKMVKVYKKVDKLTFALSYFTTNEWSFEDDNLSNLYQTLSPKDKLIYNFDITSIDWKEKCFLWALGVRKYIMRDELKTTKYAVRKQRVLRIVHYVASILYLYLMWILLKFVISYCFGYF